jgi:hypothetical protein
MLQEAVVVLLCCVSPLLVSLRCVLALEVVVWPWGK